MCKNMRTLYVLLVFCAFLATCLALSSHDNDEGEEDYAEVTEAPGGDSGAEQSKESSEEKVEIQDTRAQRKRNRKMKWRQRKTKTVQIGLEQKLQKLEQKMQEISDQLKDTKINPRPYKFKQVINSGFDLESAMEHKKWLLQFPVDLVFKYLQAQRLILEHGEYVLFHIEDIDRQQEVVELILLGGANVNLQEPKTLDTILHKFAKSNENVIRLLCNFGANHMALNAQNITPAMLVPAHLQSALDSCKRSKK